MPDNFRQMFHNNAKTLARYALATELALKAHRAFNLSKLTLRVAFARAMRAKAGRRAHANTNFPASSKPKN